MRDLDFATRMLTVSRAVVQVHPRFHPDGGRFLVKPYPKDKEYRRFKLSAQITAKLKAHVAERGLGRDDLLFQAPRGRAADPGAAPRCRPRRALGRTEPNAAGHRYRHGTLTGYSLGRCRCDYCRGRLLPLPGRAPRRRQGRPHAACARCDTDGHIPANWFRDTIWRPAD